MIVSTPINLPKLQPDDWDKWWYIWKNNAAPLRKIGDSPNKEVGRHTGFDVFRTPGIEHAYVAKYLDLKSVYPMLYDQIMSVPIHIYMARFVLSNGSFIPHIDKFSPNWAIRTLFYCEDPVSQWYYTNMDNTDKKYLTFPESTNWWAYRDGVVKHGTNYRKQYPKIILQIFSEEITTDKFIETQLNIFPDHQIEYDID